MGNFTRLRLFSRIQRLRNDRRIFSCLLWTVLKRATARDQKTYRQNYSCEWVHVLICVRFRTRKIRSWRRTSGWTWCVPNLSASIAATSSRMLLKLPTNFLQSVAVTIQYKRKFLKSIFSKLWPFGGLPIKGYENLRFFYCKRHITAESTSFEPFCVNIGWGSSLQEWTGKKARKSREAPIGIMCCR